MEDIRAELERIERAVDGGDTDLAELGFWRVLGRVKADPALVARFADQAGRIDGKVFVARVRPRFPVWSGNLVLLAGIVVGAAAVVVAARADEIVSGLALVAAAGVWSVSVHSPAHWVVGRLVGIRFTCYFVGGPPPPRPGIKTDYATYLRTAPAPRAWMHASGAIATKIAPFVALAFYPVTHAPAWAAWVVLALGILQIVTDITLSAKTSDWKKFRREMAFARERPVAG